MNFSSMREAVKKKLTCIIEARMPKHTKRLTSMTSLLAYMQGTTSLDKETAAKLNAIMELGSDTAALKLPAQLSRVIWNGRVQKLDPVAQPQSISQRATKVMQGFPAWLRYDDESIIRADVETLIHKFAH